MIYHNEIPIEGRRKSMKSILILMGILYSAIVEARDLTHAFCNSPDDPRYSIQVFSTATPGGVGVTIIEVYGQGQVFSDAPLQTTYDGEGVFYKGPNTEFRITELSNGTMYGILKTNQVGLPEIFHCLVLR